MAVDDYDLAGAAVGAVEADAVLGPERVQHGDVVVAIGSSGLHSNGFSLVRRIVTRRGLALTDHVDEFAGPVGAALLEPTRLYTAPLLRLIDEVPGAVHALSHVTGGGIAANLARVLPRGAWVELDRSTWSPQPVFRVLAEWGDLALEDTEGTWNLGVGMIAIVTQEAASSVTHALTASGLPAWVAGRVTNGERDLEGFERGAKGVDGGAVKLVGDYA
jgi:phosphoribosylformylglycinamidine cyclo-ligase